MQIPHPDSGFCQIICQVLGHLLGQGGHQNLILLLDLPADFSDQIVNLALHRPHINLRIQKTGRPDHLLCAKELMLLLVFPRRCRAEQHLINLLLKFLKIQRPVIQCRWEPESVIHKGRLPASVPVIHGTDLRNRHMRLIHNNQIVLREEVHQRQRLRSRRHEIQMSGIVLNTGTEAGLPHHLDVEIRPLGDTLRLNQLVLSLEITNPFLQFLLNVLTGKIDLLLRNDIVRSRIDHDVLQTRVHTPVYELHLTDPVNFVTEKLHPDQILTSLRRIDLNGISPHTEITSLQTLIISLILDGNQITNHIVPVLLHARSKRNRHSFKFIRRTQAVNAGYAGNHNNIPPF